MPMYLHHYLSPSSSFKLCVPALDSIHDVPPAASNSRVTYDIPARRSSLRRQIRAIPLISLFVSRFQAVVPKHVSVAHSKFLLARSMYVAQQ